MSPQDPRPVDPPTGATAAGPSRRRRSRRWVAVLAIAIIGLLVLDRLWDSQPFSAGQDERAEAVALRAEDIAAAVGGAPEDVVRTSPPVDVALAERTVRGLTAGRAPLPDARSVSTYRERGAGREITSVVLVYDDPARVQGLDRLAIPLLKSTFGLEPAAVDVAGAEDARLWTSPAYQAISFRHGGVVVFVGATGAEDAQLVRRLAERALERLRQPEAMTTPLEP